MEDYLKANWFCPSNVIAYTSLRTNGFSEKPYVSFNLGDHVKDNPTDVNKNRRKLFHDLNLPSEVLWLNQVHGNQVIHSDNWEKEIEADGVYSNRNNTVLGVMSADCLPILFCDSNGNEIMALHGGWRSLAAGIIIKGLKHFKAEVQNIQVWLGPAIGAEVFEVGTEVKTLFLDKQLAHTSCFRPSPNHRWLMDIYKTARFQLESLGIKNIFSHNYCTFSQPEKFFSYRRDGVTGRMVSLIYFQ